MSEFPGKFKTYEIRNFISQDFVIQKHRIKIKDSDNIIIQFPNNSQLNLRDIHNISIENQFLLPILDYGTVRNFCFILIPPYKTLGDKQSQLSIQEKFDIVKKLIQIEVNLRTLNLIYNGDTILLNDQLEPCIMPNIPNYLPPNSPVFALQQISTQKDAYLMFGKLLQQLLREDMNRLSVEQVAIMRYLLGETLLPLNSPLQFSYFCGQIKMNNNLTYKNTYEIYKSILQLEQLCNNIQINDLQSNFLPNFKNFTEVSKQWDQLRTDIRNFENNYRTKEIKMKMLSLPQHVLLNKLKERLEQMYHSIVSQHKTIAIELVLKNVTELKNKIKQFDITKHNYYIPEKVEIIRNLQQDQMQKLDQIYIKKQKMITDMIFTIEPQQNLKSFINKIYENVKLKEQYEEIEAELLKNGLYQVKDLNKFESNLQTLLKNFRDREFCLKVAFEKDQNPKADETIKKMICDYLQIN